MELQLDILGSVLQIHLAQAEMEEVLQMVQNDLIEAN